MVGFDEIIFIAIIALLLFGPDKLPEYIRELGRFYAEFKKAQRDLEEEFNRAANAQPSAPKPPSTTVLGIARRMNIPTEGKTEDQLLKEIELAVSVETGKV
ncbi:MAG TPA: twin-arginine translocase TatA/TatE family subunit [Methanocella sp.]|uniref:Sec-independent protein translocase subunit TatA/TatB n=1 Tax=Methanocella sp. TaxID=2052833 RepID=UPI002CA2C172|nr:twin-arginine translocase TatA/TatE family subunit [Methanocella sp.]HTY90345.1 twin-arginine translocase TatA/TatE family subunit [Methanocella sp.]